MDKFTLLPADEYRVVNKTILTDFDRKILVALYEPIIGPLANSLYLALWHDLEYSESFSRKLNHHHLMSMLKANLNIIKSSRESLESIGLLKTYIKEGEINSYIYELYSPLSPYEFFSHPILSVVLYNNIGKDEYDRLKSFYHKIKVDVREYTEITKLLDEVYESGNFNNTGDIRERSINNINVNEKIDFDMLVSAIPKGLINDRALNKKTKHLINMLAFIYNIDTSKMAEIIRTVLNEFGMIDKKELRIATRKLYQFNNNALPTLVYRAQPDYLKNPDGDLSMKGKIIALFDNTTPYDFLKGKNRGVNPTSRDLKLLEMLIVDMELSPSVVNVLIDYVLRKNNNKLTNAYVETIAAQWSRANLKTAKEAMEFAEKEHKKTIRKTKVTKVKETKVPAWFDNSNKSDDLSKEQEDELNNLLKEFN